MEPGLKLNAEEWIKVMDEYIVPKCTAIMGPGRKFLLIQDNAPSNASRLACEHYSTVLHGTVDFQSQCSPDLSPSDFFVERAQDTARSASSSCQSRRIAGTFDSRVSQDMGRQPWNVRENRHCFGPQATGLRCRRKRFFFFLNSDR